MGFTEGQSGHLAKHDAIDTLIAGHTSQIAAGDVTNPASAAGVALSATFATLVSLPKASGADDAAAINALLSANPGAVVRGIPGAAYLIGQPLTIYSGTTLDMTNCSVTLTPGANCSMLRNAAFTTARTVSGITTTADSTALTGPAGSFSAADVGKPVRVWQAGTGRLPLDTTIAAFVSATAVTLAVAAKTSHAGDTGMSVGTRDRDISVIGGEWIRGANNGALPYSGLRQHSLVFARVDGLTLKPARMTVVEGRYAVTVGDVSSFIISDIRFTKVQADGVHLNGLCFTGLVANISGVFGDDCVALTTNDGNTGYLDQTICDGPVDNITFRNITRAGYSQSHAVSIYGDRSAQYPTTNISIYDAANLDCASSVGVGLHGLLNGVRVYNTIGFVRIMSQPAAVAAAIPTDITISGVKLTYGGITVGVQIFNVHCGDVTIEGVTIDGGPANVYPITVAGGAVVEALRLNNITYNRNAGALAYLYDAGTVVNVLILNGCTRDGQDFGAGKVIHVDPPAFVRRISVVGCAVENVGTAFQMTGTTGQAVDIHLSASRVIGSALVRADGCVVNVRAGASDTYGDPLVAGTGNVRYYSPELQVDIARLTPTSGSSAYNTNAALACGVGPVSALGGVWKNLHTGATYTP